MGPAYATPKDGFNAHFSHARFTHKREAAIYLACEEGATPAEAHDAARAAGAPDLSVREVREFLDELAHSRLVYAEGDRHLALALPWRLPEAV